MESPNKNQNNQTKHVKTLNDPREFNRILMQYGGIFKSDIQGFAKTITAKKHFKNFSR